MPEISLSPEARALMIGKLKAYCADTFELQLGQFEVEFFLDFIEEVCGPAFYNSGVEQAIKTYAAWSERVQEEMDLKRVL